MSLDLRSAGLMFVSGGFGLGALLLLGAALVLARPGWIGATLGFLALVYFGHELLAGESNWEALGVVGVALLLVGELSQWSMDSRLPGRYDAHLHVSRAVGTAWLVSLGLAMAFLSLAAAGLPITGGIPTVAAGMVASVALLALVSILARKSGDPSQPT
jgi:hypothetical protein